MRNGKHMMRVLLATSLLAGVSAGSLRAEEAFDLDALVAAAKQEKPINIYDSTGKIVEMAENFSNKYGLKVTGMKVSANSQLEMIIRESQSSNVQGDVVLITDAPAALAQLLPEGFVENYLPGDMASKIPEEFQDPLAISTNANVWAYNTEAYDKCPVSNIWELTETKWKGKVALVDPLTKAPTPIGSTSLKHTATTRSPPLTKRISARIWKRQRKAPLPHGSRHWHKMRHLPPMATTRWLKPLVLLARKNRSLGC